MDKLPARIREKFTIDPDTGCWNWTAAKDPLGYGRVRWQSGTKFSHRVIFQLLRHDPVGLDLDHLCRNHGCCNPGHLEPTTHAENVRRGVGAQRTREFYAAHTECPKGHPLSGENLYTHVTRKGYVNKQCRACRIDRNRESKARARQARQSAL